MDFAPVKVKPEKMADFLNLKEDQSDGDGALHLKAPILILLPQLKRGMAGICSPEN
jgi:hypothetical protein